VERCVKDWWTSNWENNGGQVFERMEDLSHC
jgi:hypothetical protein